jgi:acyl-CoA synthetase (AMP-forming)/AMP-acid ligase II
MNLTKIISNGTTIRTSGTTGPSKPIWQSPEKLEHANKAAIKCQGITATSKVLTVCSLDHAGGLLAQTLPAISVGAPVTITPFNAFKWISEITKFTHSHLTPNMARAVMGTKTFKTIDMTGIVIMCGSDRVQSDIIQAFINKGATFIVNWGMSEVGPVAINKTYKPGDEVLHTDIIMGDTTYCETKIIDNELYVYGEISVYDDWFATGDLVEYKDGSFWYLGRKHA